MPDIFVTALLVKNETVNGIIGKTQGVSKAIKPPKKPRKNKLSKLLPLTSPLALEFPNHIYQH